MVWSALQLSPTHMRGALNPRTRVTRQYSSRASSSGKSATSFTSVHLVSFTVARNLSHARKLKLCTRTFQFQVCSFSNLHAWSIEDRGQTNLASPPRPPTQFRSFKIWEFEKLSTFLGFKSVEVSSIQESNVEVCTRTFHFQVYIFSVLQKWDSWKGFRTLCVSKVLLQ